MTNNVQFGTGPVSISVEGLTQTIRALTQAGAAAEDMSALMHAIGMLVVDDANTPVKKGKLEKSIRAGKGKTKAVVRAGGARAPYAGVLEYGWPAKNKPALSFLRDSLDKNRQEIFDKLDEGLSELLRQNNLI